MLDTLLTVASGLAAVYVIFALITSHVVEAISTLLNKRGTLLFGGLTALLDATKEPGGTRTLTEYFYAHPLIGNLGTPGRKPSYIPARTFTLSLVGTLREFVNLKDAAGQPRDVAMAATPAQLLADLRDRIAGLGTADPLGTSLRFILEGTEQTYESALHALDAWFDSQMDRISGTYRRWAWAWQAAIGLAIVVLANADSIAILRQLSTPGLANSLVHVAAKSSSDQSVAVQAQALASTGLQFGWGSLPGDASAWLGKIGGLMLTWFAVLLGAQFWFDLLKQLVPVRITGAIPASPTSATSTRDAQAKQPEA